MSAGLTPFRIDVADSVLADLKARLTNARWPDELDGVGWDYGATLAAVKHLCTYWLNEFDWRSAEARLNEWPQFTTTIDGQNIHYAHVRSPHDGAFPLVVTHGWPGSIMEFQKIVGPLTNPTEHGGRTPRWCHTNCLRAGRDFAFHRHNDTSANPWFSQSSHS